MFDCAEAHVFAGKEPHWFLPTWLMVREWSRRPDGSTALVTPLYATSQVRKAFQRWHRRDAARRCIRLVTYKRTGREGVEGVYAPGLSVWLTTRR